MPANTTVTFSAPQSLLDKYVAGACGLYGYSPLVPSGNPPVMIPNPVSSGVFGMQHIISHCAEIAQAWAAKQADAARVSAIQAIQQEVAAATITMSFIPGSGS